MSAVPSAPCPSILETPWLEKMVDLAVKMMLSHSVTGTGCGHFPYLSPSTFRRRGVWGGGGHADTNNPPHNPPDTHLFISHKRHMLENLVGRCCSNYAKLDSLWYNGLMSLDICHRIPLTHRSTVLQRLEKRLKSCLCNKSSIFKRKILNHFIWAKSLRHCGSSSVCCFFLL